MRNAFSFFALAGLAALVAAGCSGGSSGSSSARISCAGGESFCIISCDLGCSQTGCAVNEIAENQRLRFNFSQDLDPASVNSASFSIRTVTGDAPEGDVSVSGNVLTFTPRVRTVNGISSFGFLRNETYLIAMPGGVSGSFGLTSRSGDRLAHEFLCTVVATRGIIDDDQQAPTALLVAPTNLTAAPRDPTIILRFSELIDTTPLRGVLTAASPVRFTLLTTQEVGGVYTCSPGSGTTLEGIPTLRTERVGSADVTVVEFQPSVLLPGLSCVKINVTADLRDLSGRAAIPAEFSFITEAGVPFPIDFLETFDSESKLDPLVSSGAWNGVANPGLLGGDGRHGSFSYTIGSPLSASVYEIDAGSTVIPASRSLTGLEYTITDGKFYFTDFDLPAGITVNFVGDVPPQIWVRGSANIAGSLKLNGATMHRFNSRGTTLASGPTVAGQAGGAPGPGGGSGGRGGNECPGTGPQPAYNGQPGEDVQVPAGHAYAGQTANTGGRGSTLMPANGLIDNTITQPLISNLYRVSFSAGGSGGGFSGPGGTAALGTSPPAPVQTIYGTPPVAGLAFDLSTMTIPTGVSSLDFYMVGGSGGGGGGSHNYGTLWPATFDAYMAGAGGSGGGGTMALRVGGDLLVAGSGILEAKGGAGVLINGRDDNNTIANSDWGICSPGGGGSGGSILLQAGGDMEVFGLLDTSGGGGSSVGNVTGTTAVVNLSVHAGAGANGFYRLEAGGNLTVGGSGHVPPYTAGTNSGALTDRDDRVGCTSTWYDSQQVFPPAWLRYELDVDDGSGTIVTYTDSGAPGTVVANDPNGPVMILFQGGIMQQGTGLPEPGSLGEWRPGIGSGATSGISLDAPTGFRFRLEFNTGTFPNAVVHELRVFARG